MIYKEYISRPVIETGISRDMILMQDWRPWYPVSSGLPYFYLRDSMANDPLARDNESFSRYVREIQEEGLYYNFSRALYSQTIETGKTIERQACVEAFHCLTTSAY